MTDLPKSREELTKVIDEINERQRYIDASEPIETAFKRTEVLDDAPPKEKHTSRQWEAIRDECVSGGQLNETCEIIAAGLEGRLYKVVFQKLSCGCILIPLVEEEDETLL